MQTILVPVDFSAAAENALRYANKLAVKLPAEIVLVHSATSPARLPEERAALRRRLEALAERLRYQQLTRQGGRRIRYYYHLAAEALPDCLQVLVTGYCASLVVTGLALDDCAAATAAGTTPQGLPERVSCPVLVVPPGHHELPAHVVMAGDFDRVGTSQLASLPALARTPAAQFELVQFYQESQLYDGAGKGLTPLKKALLRAQQSLPNATTHLLPEEDALEGITEFCAQHATQLLVLATTDGCLVRRFFHPHYRQTHAYHLRIPALLLPMSTLPSAACCARCALRQAAAGQLAQSSKFFPQLAAG
ncbi:MAG TPA: universal stress protein [Hymenobacter sp.]|uniref:universal stress protein n=1 Tax=Hymenobacter sp. TaxID=1898978 RepID=UPI002D7E180B|nr:universal stress protein [Hymenobacter sp.]HET9503073.1 universal stress protein [Hymenobacter sp.]